MRAAETKDAVGGRLVYRLGGNAAGEVVVDDGHVVLGEVDVKLHVGCTLQDRIVFGQTNS